MNNYLIVSGEPSGDIHAANLMSQIKILQPDATFVGIGGERMIAEGLKSIASMSDVAVVGFWEVAKRYSYFKSLLNKCVDILKNENIKAFIPVDYPGFNIRLASYSKNLAIPVYYYIAPQLWAWGKNRANKLAQVADKLLVVFPFEVEYFSKFGIDTQFVGHPLLDNMDFNSNFKTISERNRTIAFFPGSRSQEIKKHLKLFSELLICNKNNGYNFSFTLAKSNNIQLSAYSEFANLSNVEINDNNIEIMKNSVAGIIKTGTSNLEAALCGMPFAMFYKTSYLTFKIAENLINLPYISIVNILCNHFIIKEFIQKDAKPKNILDNISDLVNSNDDYSNIQKEFSNIRNLLGGSGASKRAAEIITGNVKS